MLSRDMYEYACTFHNLLFLICSVDGLNQILEYKNVNDIPIYMFYSFFCLYMYFHIFKQNSCRAIKGARWLSGRVSDSGARGPGFETYRRRVVSLSKTLYSPKVLVNYPGSDGSVPT